MSTKRMIRSLVMFAVGFFMSTGLLAWAYGDKPHAQQVAQAQHVPGQPAR